MPATNYHTVNGRLRGESTNSDRLDYAADVIGSLAATVNASAAVVNTYRFKPWGAQLAKSGGGVDPRFGWREGQPPILSPLC